MRRRGSGSPRSASMTCTVRSCIQCATSSLGVGRPAGEVVIEGAGRDAEPVAHLGQLQSAVAQIGQHVEAGLEVGLPRHDARHGGTLAAIAPRRPEGYCQGRAIGTRRQPAAEFAGRPAELPGLDTWQTGLMSLWHNLTVPQHTASRGPGRPPAAKAAETRERIVQAAREVFSELGYDAATFQAIAIRADLTRPAINHYFASKRVLWREVVEQTNALVVSAGMAKAQSQTSLLGRLSAFFAVAMQAGLRRPFCGSVSGRPRCWSRSGIPN